MKKCPKCGFERTPTDAGTEGVCTACGLVFAKWVSRALGTDSVTRVADEEKPQGENRIAMLVARLTYVEPHTDPILF